MAMYLIGDIQGCDAALGRLLRRLDFSPSRDTVYLLGDLVNRGPDSAAVLRRLMALGDSARALLGNHDLHLLAAAQGVRSGGKRDTLNNVLDAPDRDLLLDWVRHQPLARLEHGILMVHAGVLPQWTADEACALANEVHTVLRGPAWADFLATMYGNEPAAWDARWQGADRLRVIVNALTRLRFCTPEGVMEFSSTESAGSPPAGHLPWFDAPGRQTAGTPVAFGHWSTLGWLDRPDLFSMDTGCVWGGALSACRFDGGRRELVQEPCDTCQTPG